MRKTFYPLIPLLMLLLCLSMGSSPVKAGVADVELRPISPEQLAVQPGKVVTLSLLVLNHSGVELDFFEELSLPSDWQVIVPTTAFKLSAYDQQVRLVSVLVPASTPAGAYEIGYALTRQGAQRDLYQTVFNVEVAAVSQIEALIEEKPEFVVAGEQYEVGVRYLNKGNSAVTLSFELSNTPEFPVEFAPKEISLSPGASRLLVVTVTTDSKLETARRHVLNIKAINQKTLLPCRSDTVLVNVIPTIAGEYDFYHRIPSYFNIITGGAEQGPEAELNPGFQLEFSGMGSFDEQGKHRVALSFLTPNLFGNNFAPKTPNFEFAYTNKFLDITAGSRNMVLSTLTKRWNGYHNLQLKVHPRNHTLGVINPGRSEQGIFYGYQFADWLGMRINYLRADTDRLPAYEIYSLQTDMKPWANTSLRLEYATNQLMGDNATAYRANFQGHTRKFHYALEKIQADSDFLGNYQDLDSLNGTVSFLLYNKLQTTFSYHDYRTNRALDPAKDVARDELTYLTNLSYYLTPRTVLLFSWRETQKSDRLLPAEYDYQQRLIRMGLQHQFPRWRVSASLGMGNHADKLGLSKVQAFKTYNFHLNYIPNSHQTYLFFINSGDQNYQLTPDARRTLGVKANLNLSKNFHLTMEYQRRNTLTAGEDYLAADLSYTFRGLTLAIKGMQLYGANNTDSKWTLLASYRLPCNIPTVKRKEVGVIKGKILGETDLPLPNVVVKANGATTITNEAGEFVFAAFPPGTYSLTLDQLSVGLNMTPLENLPLLIGVQKGETAEVEIRLVPTAAVVGKTVLLAPDDHQASTDLDLYVSEDQVFSLKQGAHSAKENSRLEETRKKRGLVHTLIELSNGRETFRQVTDARGEFSFTGIRPGQWLLKAYGHSLPPHFYFETAEVQMDLKPGARAEFVFEAIPQIRSIRIVEEGEITPDGAAISTGMGLSLDELFVTEYYSITAAATSPWASLDQAGFLRHNYLERDRYFTDTVYIVKEGDTLAGIADKFGVPLQRIVDLNFLGTTGLVKTNTVLIIPIPVELIYVVKTGETLATIADQFGTTIEILEDLNSIDATEQLEAGQLLVLPGR